MHSRNREIGGTRTNTVRVMMLGLALAPWVSAWMRSGQAHAAKPKKVCEPALQRPGSGSYRFSKTGMLAGLDLMTPSGRDQSLAHLVVSYFSKKKVAPSFDQLCAWAERHTDHESEAIVAAVKDARLFNRDGELQHKKLKSVLINAAEKDPELFTHLHAVFAQQAFLFFRHRLRPPTVSELSEILGIEDKELVSLIVHLPGFWEGLLESDLGRHIEYARKRINAAFARAVRGSDTPASLRTRKIPPTPRRIVEMLALARGNEHYQWRVIQGDYLAFPLFDRRNGDLDLKNKEAMLETLTAELEAILGLRKLDDTRRDLAPEKQWVFEMPVLYPRGLEELYESARFDFQASFTTYMDIEKFPISKMETLAKKIADAPGFVVTSFKPGRAVDWAQLAGMKQMARDRGYPVVLIPENGLWQDIDPRLLSDPEIHILSHTIQNSELLLSNLPSNDRSNVLGPFLDPGRFEVGQQIICAHNVLEHVSIPTSKNQHNQSQVYSTGTVNIAEVAATSPSELAKAQRIASEMKQAFLVVEKIDRGAPDALGVGGVGNHWHIRPVEVKPSRKFNGVTEPVVFADNADLYTITVDASGSANVQRGSTYATIVKFSDAHFIWASPDVLMSAEATIGKITSPDRLVEIHVPDAMDVYFLNAHQEKKQKDVRGMRGKIANGRALGNHEINDMIGNYNELLREFPNAVIVNDKANHPDWIDRNLLNDPSLLQEYLNGDLRDELLMALRYNPQWTPMEYLLLHRKDFLSGLTKDGSDRWAEGKVFIDDPSRIRVLRGGEAVYPATIYKGYEMAQQHHGDKGANGAKSSFRAHQVGEKRSMTGDAHRMGYRGVGENFWIGVGSFYPFVADYTREGYSSWGIGLGIQWAEGTATLLQFDPISKSFDQRPDYGVYAGDQFFGADPLEVVSPMDDDAARIVADEAIWTQWLRNKVLGLMGKSSSKK